jgi:tetratricopeptide (TPR) repeat protein
MADDAINNIKKALEIDPEMADAHYYLGVIYASKNMYEEAIAENKKVLVVNPDYANAHFNLGTIYHMQDLLDKAIDEYETTISIDRGFADAYYNKGKVLEAMGKKADARNEFEKYRMVRQTGRGSPNLLSFDAKLLGTMEAEDARKEYEKRLLELEEEENP